MTDLVYYYSAHSAFAYLGSARVMEICATHGLTLVHRPIPLLPVVEAQGSLPFHARTQAHVDYFFGREIERWAEWQGVPVVRFRPPHHDADLSDFETLSALAQALGHDAEGLMAKAQSAEITARYAQNAVEALAAEVPGSPTYVLKGEVFYGQDRLEMLERAVTQPFAPSRWVNPAVD